MKKAMMLVGCIIVMFLSVLARAESEGNDLVRGWEPHGFISSTLQERYIGLRVSRNLYNDPMLWTEIYVKLPKGFFVDAWWSMDLQDDEVSSTWGDEVDFTLGWQKNVQGLDLSLSVAQYISSPFGELWGKSNAWSQDLILSKKFSFGEKHTVTPAFWIGYLSMNDDFEKGALFALPNVKHDWKEPFGIKKLTFSHTAMLAWDDGFGSNSSDGLFLRWMPALNWKISDRFTITAPGVIILEPLTDPHDGRRGGVSLSFSATYKF